MREIRIRWLRLLRRLKNNLKFRNKLIQVGNQSGGGIPSPIPNLEVKPSSDLVSTA